MFFNLIYVRDTFQVSVTWSIGLVHGGDVDYSLTVILVSYICFPPIASVSTF